MHAAAHRRGASGVHRRVAVSLCRDARTRINPRRQQQFGQSPCLTRRRRVARDCRRPDHGPPRNGEPVKRPVTSCCSGPRPTALATCRGRRRRASSTITLVAHDPFAACVGARRLHEANGRGEGAPVGRLGPGAEPGDLDNPVGDVLFGVDNTFLPRSTRDLEPYESWRWRRCLKSSSSTPPPPDATTARLHQLRQAVVCEAEDRGADVARRPHQACVRGQARGREPGNVVSGLASSHDRARWRRRWRATGTSCGERRRGRRR